MDDRDEREEDLAAIIERKSFIMLKSKKASPTGNRTRVSHVTGEGTHHYIVSRTPIGAFPK